MTIMWCMVPEIWSKTDIIFCHFGPFFTLLPSKKKNPKKSKFWKNEKKKYMEISSFYTVYQKSWLYATLFLRYNAWQMLFLLFILDIIILHMCTKNYDHMMYGSWDMVHNRWMDEQITKWHLEMGAPPKKTKILQWFI